MRTVWNGLRFLSQAAQKTDAANAVLTAAMLRTNRSKMGKYGARSDQLAHIIGVKSYVSLLADVNVLTIDKYGPNAPILTGELAKVDGVPIVLSEYVRQDLNATGVFDNVTTNRSLALTVNRRGFLLGQRRGSPCRCSVSCTPSPTRTRSSPACGRRSPLASRRPRAS